MVEIARRGLFESREKTGWRKKIAVRVDIHGYPLSTIFMDSACIHIHG
jgi:hypothetical protein